MTDPIGFSGELLGASALAGLGVWALHRPTGPMLWRELRFPSDLTSQQVESLLGHVAASQRPVVFIIDGQSHSVRFRIGASKGALASITAAASGIAPELRLDAVDGDEPPVPTNGVRAWWRGGWPLLRSDQPELAVADLLGQFSSLGRGERLRLIVRLVPVRRRAPVPQGIEPAALRAVTAKRDAALLRAEVLLAVTAVPPVRARQLSQAVITTLRALTGQRGRLRVRRLSAAGAQRAMAVARRSRPWSLTPTTVLSPSELVPIVALPIGAPRLAGLSFGTAPRLMPPLDLPSGPINQIRAFALSTWPRAMDRPLAQPIVGGLQHTAIIGPTGSGKSSLIGRLVEQDIAAGRGALVIDCNGDLIGGDDGLLARIPEHRHSDVILLDPASGGPQPGPSLFPSGAEHELTADLLLGTLSQLYADSWGIRTSSYLSLGLRTLALGRGASLPLLPLLFTDRDFRNRMLRGVSDPLLLAAWQRFEALSAADQATQLAPALRKIDELVGRARLRVVLGQSQPRLHLGEVLWTSPASVDSRG